MKKELIIAGRKSKLSKAQINECVQEFSNHGFPINIKYIETYGDIHTESPINQLLITNPFTKEIHQAILDGSVDLGISSLKDVEISETDGIQTVFFSKRQNPRDVLLLNTNAIEKIQNGEELIIGTSSTRRKFLFGRIAHKILPHNPKFSFKDIRGNITTRISFLQNSNVDGIILAIAGIQRLAESEKFCNEITELLTRVRSIVLPITHFPTPPGQGVVIAQSKTGTQFDRISKLSNVHSKRVSLLEKQVFFEYGKGCKEGYGVTHLSYKNHECTFIKGITSSGIELNIHKNFTKPKFIKLFDSRKLRPLLKKTPINSTIPSSAKKFIVANINAVNSQNIIDALQNAEEVWTLGLMTQQKLCEMGIICNGNVETLGISALDEIHFTAGLSPLYKKDCYILTYQGKTHEKYKTIASYSIKIDKTHEKYNSLTQELSQCDAVFWTSCVVYHEFKAYFQGKTHITLLGETFDTLITDGLTPHGIFNFEILDEIIKGDA
ncbi:MAG: hypothetical protein O3A66_01670 [Proteobacteria bacterium]|jgi:hydroxymethylbilane synthase|nr:hypothetical protein [Pseudomonadota bacterium]